MGRGGERERRAKGVEGTDAASAGPVPPRKEPRCRGGPGGAAPETTYSTHRHRGERLQAKAINHTGRACQLPIAVAGALMPDACVGYGLPIGGVVVTENHSHN